MALIAIKAHLAPGYSSLRMDGHDHGATAVVCAAITAVFETALLGLEQIAKLHPETVTCDISEGVDAD